MSLPSSTFLKSPSLLRQRSTLGLATALPRPWRAARPARFATPATTCRSRRPVDDEDYFYRRSGGSNFRQRGGRGGRRDPFSNATVTQTSLVEYALPAAVLLLGAVIVGPLLGSLVFAALGVGVAVTAASAFMAFSWAFLPLLLGGGLVMGTAVTAGLFAASAGGLLIFNLLKLGALGVAVWLGYKFADSVFNLSSGSGGSGRSREVDPDGTIDVDATTIDDWRDEAMREQRRREAELREFDDLLKRREEFKKGGRGGSGL